MSKKAASTQVVEPPDFDWKNPDYDTEFRQRMAAAQRMRDGGPGVVAKMKEYYRNDVVAFIDDWGMTFDPRNAEIGLPTGVPFVLFPKQAEFLEWMKARWLGREDGLVEKSRDMGVTWLCVAFGVWMMRFHPGTVVGFGSRKEEYVDKIGDPKSIFWKARYFIQALPIELRPTGWNEKVHAPHMRILDPETGSSIVGEAGDNIGRGNRTSVYVKDESAHYERPELIEAALSQTSNCKIDVSTPNGPGNPFYQKRHGGKIKVFIFDWRDDPRKDEAWYEKQVATLDPVTVAQEIDRNYEASVSNAFIPGEIVKAAALRGPADVRANGGLRVGVDPARFGDDRTVITFRRGRVLLKQIKLVKLDVPSVAGRVRAEVNAYGEHPEQIAVDVIGLGAGVADLLRGYFPDRKPAHPGGRSIPVVVDVNVSIRMDDGHHYNLRAFMWNEVKEWLKTASIPNDPELITDLTALRYFFRGGEMLLESKDDAKKRGVRSPDHGDSLALTFAIPTIVPARRHSPRIEAQPTFDPSLGALG